MEELYPSQGSKTPRPYKRTFTLRISVDGQPKIETSLGFTLTELEDSKAVLAKLEQASSLAYSKLLGLDEKLDKPQ